MKFIPIEALPKKTTKRMHRKDLEKMLADFMESDIKLALVELDSDDYSDTMFCRNSLRAAIARYRYPVKVHYRSGNTYLCKIV